MADELLEACVAGKFASAKDVIQRGCDPKTAKRKVQYGKEDGYTPLHYGCENGDLGFVRFLVETHSCNPDCESTLGITPLHLASKSGSIELVTYLVTQCKCGLTCTTKYDKETPLHWACKGGSVAVVRYLITELKCNPEQTNVYGKTSLHLACQSGSIEVIKYLVTQCKCDVTCTDYRKQTPLHYACSGGSLAVVRYLITELKCDPDKTNEFGQTSLHLACRSGSIELVTYLVTQCKCDVTSTDHRKETPLHWACKGGSLAVVRYLITELKCDPKQTSKYGETSLHLASQEGNLQVVQYLVEEEDCNKECTDNRGWTPLHLAIEKEGKLQVVQYLVGEQNCNKECTDKNGWTPLHLAIENGNLQVVQYLVGEQNCNKECADNRGWTPLHQAVEKGNLQLVQYLVGEQNCNKECSDEEGRTPLHLAVESGDREVVKYLLEEVHCNPNCTDKNGFTPLSVTRDPIISKYLVASGATPADLYRRHGQQIPAVSVNTFVIGNQGNGKSSLSKVLGQYNKGFARLTRRVVKVTGVDEKTAGIIPYNIQSKHFGRLTLYDFAGHKEYYSSNGAMIRSVTMGSTAALFLLVADLQSSDTEFTKTITYWLHFVKTECIRSKTGPNPHIIIVGSFADKIKSKSELSRKREIVESLLPTPVFSGIHFSSFVTTNCCFSESSSMSDLRKNIAKSCDVLKSKAVMSFNSHCFFLYLLDKYRQCPAVTLDTIHSQIQGGDGHELQESIPQTIPELCKACEDLSERGSILFVQKADDVKRSWVVLDREALLSQVTGTVFAPEDIKKHNSTLASSTGVVPFSNIKSQFPTLDPHMVVAYMSYLEFCHEIVDREALHFLQALTNELLDSTTQFYFFPGLVRVDAPRDVWKADPQFVYQSGWVLQCSEPHEFLTPRLVEVLLLRIAFSFALGSEQKVDHPALQRKCLVWKNGICWINRDGVECLVEIAGSKRVILMLRCLAECKLQCVRHRSLIVQKILNTLEDCCSEISTTTTVLLPSDVSYPLESTKQPVQFTIREIAKAVMGAKPGAKPSAVNEDNKLATLEELLYFEPYSDLGEHILKELCSKHKQGTKITDSFLRHITDRIQNKRTFIDLFKSTTQHFHGFSSHSFSCSDEAHELVRVFQLWRNRGGGTYECLTQELDKFSIFAGKNPLEMAGVFVQPPEPWLRSDLQPDEKVDDAILDEKPEIYELQLLHGEDRETVRVINEAASKWEELAYGLHFKSHDVANIKKNNPSDVTAACREVLIQWEAGKGRKPVEWRTLLQALEDAQLDEVAPKLRSVLCSKKTK